MNILPNINLGGIGAINQIGRTDFEAQSAGKIESKALNVSVNAFSDVEDVDPVVEAAINPADDMGKLFDKAFNLPPRAFNPEWFK